MRDHWSQGHFFFISKSHVYIYVYMCMYKFVCMHLYVCMWFDINMPTFFYCRFIISELKLICLQHIALFKDPQHRL